MIIYFQIEKFKILFSVELYKLFYIIILVCILKFSKIIYSKIFKLYFNCKYCINTKNIYSKWFNCSIDDLFSSIKIMSTEETLNEILNKNKSIGRFGDGEFNIIFGTNIRFQIFNKTLQEFLLKVLNTDIPNFLVGIIPLTNITNSYWINYINENKFKLLKIINKNKIYYNSLITRFFSDSRLNKVEIKNYIMKFKQIWNNRNILIIEGEKTRLGIGNDLLNNCKSIKRIICPTKNAFNVFTKVYDFVKNLKLDRNILILISLGPTASVLSYEIHKLGYQTLDFGHFDIQYEYFIRNVTKKIKISTKYVNEVKGGDTNIIPIKDKNYYKQIIFKAF